MPLGCVINDHAVSPDAWPEHPQLAQADQLGQHSILSLWNYHELSRTAGFEQSH
jgi:hypothetical protein